MKNAVIFFSLTGNTKHIAELLSENYNAKLIELDPKGFKLFKVPVHFVKKLFGLRLVDVKDIDLNGYNIVFIGGPIWNWRPCPAVIDALNNLNLVDKKVVAFVCHGGGPGKSKDVIRELVESAGAKLLDVLSFTGGLTDDEILKEFKDALKKDKEETE